MTPTAKQHPQRCKTCDSCDHAEKLNAPFYPFKCLISKPVPMLVHDYCVQWFGYVGCASYSTVSPATTPEQRCKNKQIPGSCDLTGDPCNKIDCAIARAREEMIKQRQKETGLSYSEIIHLAENDWHAREERRNLHPMIPWTQGWITGFLTPEKPYWNRVRESKAKAEGAKEEREMLLTLIENELKERVYKSSHGLAPYDFLYESDVDYIIESLRSSRTNTGGNRE